MDDKIFVVIVTYNGQRWIDKCIRSIQNSSIATQIIIVDNASTDQTINLINTKHTTVKIFEENSNLGFGKANNIGIKDALDQGADYIFLLNQDAWVNPDTFEKLIAVHKKHPDYGILSPLHLNGTGRELDGGFLNYAGPEFTPKLLNDFCLNRASDIYESRFVNAAAWLISRACLLKVGGFDPIFFHYGEDNNYCQRVVYHGLKIGIVPSVNIFHDRVYNKEKKYENMQNVLYYMLKVADIGNPNIIRDHKKLCRQDWIRMAMGILSGDLKKFRNNYQNLRTKKRVFPNILKSRKINMAGGPAYIS